MPDSGPGPAWLILPTYEEAENIEPLVEAALANLPASSRILIVDDNSPDGTGEVADRLAEAHEEVEVLHRPGKEGLGLAYMAGPTGGYLVGFLVAAVFMGWAAERGWDRTLLHTAVAMTIGTVLMFLFGVGWLAVFLGNLDKALAGGLYPFIAGGIVKIALATVLMPFCWKLLGRFGR